MLLPSLSSLLTPEPNLFPLGRAGKGKTSPTLLLPVKPALGVTIWPLSSLPSDCFFSCFSSSQAAWNEKPRPLCHGRGFKALPHGNKHGENLPAAAGPEGWQQHAPVVAGRSGQQGEATEHLPCSAAHPAQPRAAEGCQEHVCPHSCNKPMCGVEQQHLHSFVL